uniref:Uncharacterized protein n=1 Tax=Ciona intestinalis TaxID=7719 RepID=H2XJP0_CIOIN
MNKKYSKSFVSSRERFDECGNNFFQLGFSRFFQNKNKSDQSKQPVVNLLTRSYKRT